MFENKFNTRKTDPLVEAVMNAQKDGEIRRQAIAAVNEEFGVYNRNAVVRENLAAYDARIEEEYKCMKEGKPLDPVGKEDPQGDVNNNGIPASKDKSDQYLLKRRAAIGKAMGKRMEEESDGLPPSAAAKQAAKQTSTPASTPTPTRTKDLSSTFSSARGAAGMNEAKIKVKGNDPLEARAEYAKKGGTGQVYKKTHPKDKVGMSQADAYAIRGTGPKRGSHLPEETLDEATYSAKAARAGKDIGKKGKEFEKIAKSAAKRYGSEERGKKVAGAILKRIRAKHMEEATQIDELSAFGQAFRDAGGKNFTFGGKSYSGARADNKSTSTSASSTPGTQGVATGKSFSAIDRAQAAKAKSGPADNPGLRGSTMPKTPGTVARDTGVTGKPSGETGVASDRTVSLDRPGNPGASPSAAPAPAPKPNAPALSTSSSTPSGARSTTSSGLVGPDAAKMMTPSRPAPSAPVTSQPGAPKDDASAGVKKLMSMNESVQVGDNKYRIV